MSKTGNAISTSETQRPERHSGDDDVQASFVRFCSCLGMAPEAAHAWANMYNRPHFVCVLNLAASFTGHSLIGVTYLIGFQQLRQIVHIPLAVYLCFISINYVGMWRWGPLFARTKVSRLSKLVAVPNLIFVSGVSIIGPAVLSPFGSRLVTTLVLSAGAVGSNIAAKFGSMATDQPQGCKCDILQPLTLAMVSSARTIDCLTDMAIIRKLLDVVCLRWSHVSAMSVSPFSNRQCHVTAANCSDHEYFLQFAGYNVGYLLLVWGPCAMFSACGNGNSHWRFCTC